MFEKTYMQVLEQCFCYSHKLLLMDCKGEQAGSTSTISNNVNDDKRMPIIYFNVMHEEGQRRKTSYLILLVSQIQSYLILLVSQIQSISNYASLTPLKQGPHTYHYQCTAATTECEILLPHPPSTQQAGLLSTPQVEAYNRFKTS